MFMELALALIFAASIAVEFLVPALALPAAIVALTCVVLAWGLRDDSAWLDRIIGKRRDP